MEITPPFLDLLQQFAPVFTAPTQQTFALIVTGWLLSHRHLRPLEYRPLRDSLRNIR